MRTQIKTAAQPENTTIKLNINDHSVDSQGSSLSGLLGKRASNDTSIEKLRAETGEDSRVHNIEDTSNSNEDSDGDDDDKRERRLMQNRKSAKKCRLKKKAEYGQMKGDVMKLQEENKNLKEKINEITIMLYQKMEENTNLQRKLEQTQMQQAVFLSQMMQQQQTQNTGIPCQSASSITSNLSAPGINGINPLFGSGGVNNLPPSTATNQALQSMLLNSQNQSNPLGLIGAHANSLSGNGLSAFGSPSTLNSTSVGSQNSSMLQSLFGGLGANKLDSIMNQSASSISAKTNSSPQMSGILPTLNQALSNPLLNLKQQLTQGNLGDLGGQVKLQETYSSPQQANGQDLIEFLKSQLQKQRNPSEDSLTTLLGGGASLRTSASVPLGSQKLSGSSLEKISI